MDEVEDDAETKQEDAADEEEVDYEDDQADPEEEQADQAEDQEIPDEIKERIAQEPNKFWPPFDTDSIVAHWIGTFHEASDSFARDIGHARGKIRNLYPPDPDLIKQVFGTPDDPVLSYRGVDTGQHVGFRKNTQQICKQWNDDRDQTGRGTCQRAGCQKAHCCDALVVLPPRNTFPEKNDNPMVRVRVRDKLAEWISDVSGATSSCEWLRQSSSQGMTTTAALVTVCGSTTHTRADHLDYAPGVKTSRDENRNEWTSFVPVRHDYAHQIER